MISRTDTMLTVCISALICFVAWTPLQVQANTNAATHKAVCKCTCNSIAGDSNREMVVDAPGGDLSKCGQYNGASCNYNGPLGGNIDGTAGSCRSGGLVPTGKPGETPSDHIDPSRVSPPERSSTTPMQSSPK